MRTIYESLLQIYLMSSIFNKQCLRYLYYREITAKNVICKLTIFTLYFWLYSSLLFSKIIDYIQYRLYI